VEKTNIIRTLKEKTNILLIFLLSNKVKGMEKKKSLECIPIKKHPTSFIT